MRKRIAGARLVTYGEEEQGSTWTLRYAVVGAFPSSIASGDDRLLK
jgi:hypothetical protein